MGQKIKPIGLRVGINRTWDSRWFAGRTYGELLHKDIELRSHLMKRLKPAGISRIVIERPAGRARITIYAGRHSSICLTISIHSFNELLQLVKLPPGPI